ncbi:MAG: hypothetical protein IKW83_05135 [Muribaculaceae bacterium]|nr:hypothetical protein [Muribaculaceae bacterium]
MKSRQKTYAWLLLTILLSMQAINAVHIHEPQVVPIEDYCDMCAHHVKHYSHISSDRYSMHPCLSCMISSSQYVTSQPALLLAVQQSVCTIDCPQTISLLAATIKHRQSRAPPMFLV